jgi:tetratricopeptide (TPR) repeat protein
LITRLTDLYQQAGQTDKAEKLLTDQLALVSAKPEEAWTKMSLLQRLVAIWQKEPGRIEKERTALEEASAKDPQNKDLLERLAYLYTIPSAKPDFAKLVAVREKLLQLSPNDTQAMMQLATAYPQNNQYDKAIEMWQKLMAADPKSFGQSAAFQISTLLNRAGKKDEAVKWAKEHLGEQPTNLANFYLQAGMIPEAEELYAKLREQATIPEQKAQYTLDIARAAQRGKDYKKAEEEAQRVLKEFPDQRMYIGQANAILQQLKAEQAGPAVKTPPTPIQPPPPPTPAK